MQVFSYISFSNFLMLLVCSEYAFRQRKGNKSAMISSLIYLCLSEWCFCISFFYLSDQFREAFFWYRLSSIGWISFPAFSLLFFLVVGNLVRKEQMPKICMLIFSVPAFFMVRVFLFQTPLLYTGFVRSSWIEGWSGVTRLGNVWLWLYIIYLFGYFLIGFWSVAKWGRESVYQSERKHSHVILLVCVSILMAGFFSDIVCPFFINHIPPVSGLALMAIAFETYYAAKHYHIFREPSVISAKTVLDYIGDPVIFFDERYRIIRINCAVTDVLGYSYKEIRQKEFSYLINGQKYNADNLKLLKKYRFFRSKTIEIRKADGSVMTALCSVSMVDNESDEFIGYILSLKDITDRVQMEKKILASNERYESLLAELNDAACYDQLTGLLNRRTFYKNLEAVAERQDFHGTVLIYGDLNGFKEVNDRFGHGVGDSVLVESARRLQDSIQDDGAVYRLGGDEFAMVLYGIVSEEKLQEQLACIRDSFRIPVNVGEGLLEIGIALGYVFLSEYGQNLNGAISAADRRMYEDKRKAKELQPDWSPDN